MTSPDTAPESRADLGQTQRVHAEAECWVGELQVIATQRPRGLFLRALRRGELLADLELAPSVGRVRARGLTRDALCWSMERGLPRAAPGASEVLEHFCLELQRAERLSETEQRELSAFLRSRVDALLDALDPLALAFASTFDEWERLAVYARLVAPLLATGARRCFLHRFDDARLVADPQPLLTLEAPALPGPVRLRLGRRDRLQLAREADGWVLVETGAQLNHHPVPAFSLLQHGDVISLPLRRGHSMGVRPLLVMFREAVTPRPRLLSLEGQVLAGGGGPAALAVLDDALSELGFDSPQQLPSGELHALLGRGLTVEWSHGFADACRLELDAPMVAGWLRRWLHLLGVEPAFRFLRRLEVIERTEMSAASSRQVSATLDAFVSARVCPLLARVELISRRRPRVDERPVEGEETTLFPPPSASSWGWDD